MNFNQLAYLGRGFSAIKAHHEKLTHGSTSALETLRSTVRESHAALYLSMSSHTDGDSMVKGGVELFMITTRCASSSDTTKFHHLI